MPLVFDDLKQIPEFQALLATVDQQAQELKILRTRHLKWVTDEQAQEITGLSRRSLLRERQRPGTLIIYKEDHGVRYDYDSLLKHKESRAIGRGRMAQLLTQ
jgi:predicted mannosyl-3-phosphoglycerate phosphatase (HAD superfamily)